MDLKRLRLGDYIAGLSGIALFVSLLFPWFEVQVSTGGSGTALSTDVVPFDISAEGDVTPWAAFGWLDLFLTLLALAGIGLLLITALQRTPAIPVAWSVVTSVVGFVLAIVTFLRVCFLQPGPNDQLAVELWGYIGVIATVGVFIGAWRAMADESSPHLEVTPLEPRPAPPANATPTTS